MALEWFDGFDQYGPVTARLLQGVYAQNEGALLSTANPRTGTYHLRVEASTNNVGMRRVLASGPQDYVGVGYAFSINVLPTNNTDFALLQTRSPENISVFTITVSSSGGLAVREGGRYNAIIAEYNQPIIFAGAYQHFECKYDSNGIKVWINEVLVIDTIEGPPAGSKIASVVLGGGGLPLTGAFLTWDIDDLYCYNLLGTENIGPIGDCKVYTRFPNSDFGTQDFTASIGTDRFQMVNNVPPQDGTEYLSSDGLSLPDRSAFGLPDLPLDIVEVKGVLLATRMFKTDAGPAILVTGVTSGASEDISANHALSQAPVWFTDVFDTDPATDGEWSLSTANDITVFVERTT